MSSDNLESLEKTHDILKDDELMESLRRSRREVEQGDRVPLPGNVCGGRMCRIEIPAEGLRHLNKLLEKGRHAALESIVGPIAHNPNRLGEPLVGELVGLWSARRGEDQIIYEVFEDDEFVLIHRVPHRSDACRPR